MILYDNREELGIILHRTGSVIHRIFPWSLLAALISIGCVYIDEGKGILTDLDDTFGVITIGGAASLALVWRTTLAWNRYWEACHETSFMYSKWTDCYSQLISFTNYAIGELEEDQSPATQAKLAEIKDIRYGVAHCFSLLSALATHRLAHGDLSRLRRRSRKFGMGSTNNPFLGVARMWRNWDKLFILREDLSFTNDEGGIDLPKFKAISIAERCEVRGNAKPERLSFMASIEDQIGLTVAVADGAGRAAVETANNITQKTAGFLRRSRLSFTNLLAFEGKGSSLSTRAEEEIQKEAMEQKEESPELLVGRRRRPRVSDFTWNAALVVLGNPTAEELRDLSASGTASESTDGKVSQCRFCPEICICEWICEEINEMIDICGIPPPILSRCYQELSNGMLGFNESQNVADIPFPLPFNQMIEVIARITVWLTPVAVAIFTRGLFVSPLLTFAVTMTYWSLGDIARVLEHPFADGPNQVPVVDMHERFVHNLRVLYHLQRNRRSGRQFGAHIESSREDVSLEKGSHPLKEESKLENRTRDRAEPHMRVESF